MIFVDTGAFVGRCIERDQYHQIAVDYWAELARRRLRCYTSSFVLDEAFTLIGRIAGNNFAAERARNIYASRSMEILRPDASVETEALEFFTKDADKDVSYTDCISFVLMKRARLRRVFSFDSHFAHAGFVVVPPPM